MGSKFLKRLFWPEAPSATEQVEKQLPVSYTITVNHSGHKVRDLSNNRIARKKAVAASQVEFYGPGSKKKHVVKVAVSTPQKSKREKADAK